MAILVRSGESAWVKAEPKFYTNEKHLQELLLKSPELVETLDGSKLLLTDEVGLSGGVWADLIGVTSSGDVLIIETKLASNAEIRRKIIGQILEYAARLWKTDYSTFNAYFEGKSSKSLIDTFSEEPEFDDETFRTQVELNLRSGRFHLLIAVDEMNDELNGILDFISAASSGLRLEALAIRLYTQGTIQVLAPQRYGVRTIPQPASSSVTKLSVEELVSKSTSEDMKSKMLLVVELWKEAQNFVFAAKVALSLRVGLPSKVVALFWATPNDQWGLQPNFASMEQCGMPKELMMDVRKQLSLLPGVNPEKMLTLSMPVTKFSNISLDTVQKFVGIMAEAGNRWRASIEAAAIASAE